METRPLIFSGFFSGPSAGCGTGPRRKPGRRQAAPPFRGPAVACLPQKSEGRQNRQNASVLWVLQNRPKQNRTGGWGLVLLCLGFSFLSTGTAEGQDGAAPCPARGGGVASSVFHNASADLSLGGLAEPGRQVVDTTRSSVAGTPPAALGSAVAAPTRGGAHGV